MRASELQAWCLAQGGAIEDSYDLVVSGLPKRARNQLGWAVREAEGPA